jgi:hypothetical protein
MINQLANILYRLLFIVSLVLFLISIWDKFIRLFGWTISWVTYAPGRILEFSAIFMIFAIAILLRQIREELKTSKLHP